MIVIYDTKEKIASSDSDLSLLGQQSKVFSTSCTPNLLSLHPKCIVVFKATSVSSTKDHTPLPSSTSLDAIIYCDTGEVSFAAQKYLVEMKNIIKVTPDLSQLHPNFTPKLSQLHPKITPKPVTSEP